MPLRNKAAKSGSSPASGSAIGVYARYPADEIKRCIEEVRGQIPAWFAANPKRKICKVDLFYGRSVDLRRENFSERLDAELAALLPQNLTSSTGYTNKARLHSSPTTGFTLLFTATCTESERGAACAVVAKSFGYDAALTLRQVKDATEIKTLVGDFFLSPKRKQVFNVWTFDQRAKS